MANLATSLVLFVACASSITCQLFPVNNGLGMRVPIHNSPSSSSSAWGSLAGRPFTLGAGADWQHQQGHGLSVSGHHQPRTGFGQATVTGQLGVLKTPNHQVHVGGSQTRYFHNSHQVGRPTNTAELGYKYTHKDTSLGANVQSSFGVGKPQHSVGLEFKQRF